MFRCCLLIVMLAMSGFVAKAAMALDPISTAIVADQTIGSILKKARDSLNDVVDNAGEEARSTIMVAAQQMILVIESLEVALHDVLDKTFENIAQERRQIINNGFKAIDEIIVGLNDGTKSVEDITALGATAIRDMPGVSNVPRVIRVSPTYVTQSELAQLAPVNFFGLDLATDEPTLSVPGGGDARRVKKIDTELSFEVSGASVDGNAIEKIFMNLTAYQPRSFLWIFPRPSLEHTFESLLYVVPDRLGSAQVTWTVPHTRRETKKFRCPAAGSDTHRSPKYKGNSVGGPTCRVDNGYTIDRDSFVFHQDESTHCEGRKSLADGRNFGYRVQCNAYGRSVYAEGAWRDHGQQGTYRGYVTVEAFKNVNGTKKVEEEPVDLYWNNDQKFDGPGGATGYTVAIQKFNGDNVVLAGQSTDPWIASQYDDGAKTLVLKPVTIDKALGR